MEKALQYYKQALTLDPNYAPAYSAIAELYWVLPFLGLGALKDDVYVKYKEAINKALEIDNNLPEAHATLGLIKFAYEWDWKGAEDAFETAINLNPGSSKSHYDYAFFLSGVVKNSDKAILEARKAIELDPLSGMPHYILGQSLFASYKFEQAIEKIRYAREMIPKHIPSLLVLISSYVEKGMLENAMDEIEKGLELFPKNPFLLGEMGTIYALIGEKGKSRAILDELLERTKKEYVPSVVFASLYADLGEMDQAFENLENGYEKREIYLSYIKMLIRSRLLRADSRFIAFLKKMGLEP